MEKTSLTSGVFSKNEGSKNETFTNCFLTDVYILRLVRSCGFPSSESRNFSEVVGLLVSEMVVACPYVSLKAEDITG